MRRPNYLTRDFRQTRSNKSAGVFHSPAFASITPSLEKLIFCRTANSIALRWRRHGLACPQTQKPPEKNCEMHNPWHPHKAIRPHSPNLQPRGNCGWTIAFLFAHHSFAPQVLVDCGIALGAELRFEAKRCKLQGLEFLKACHGESLGSQFT